MANLSSENLKAKVRRYILPNRRGQIMAKILQDILVDFADSFANELDGDFVQSDWNSTSGYSEILNKPSSFPPSAHMHTPSEVGLSNVDNTSDVNKPVSTAQAAADTATLNSAKSYADGLTMGNLRLRGNYDASGANAYPSTGGSGTAGAIRQGDKWEINVAGNGFDIGDSVYALVNTPGQTAANWGVGEHNTQQATESTRGTAKLVTQAIIEDYATTNDADMVTGKKFWQGLTKFLTLAWTWTSRQTFNTAPRLSGLTADTTLELDSNKDIVSISKKTAYNKDFGDASDQVLQGGYRYPNVTFNDFSALVSSAALGFESGTGVFALFTGTTNGGLVGNINLRNYGIDYDGRNATIRIRFKLASAPSVGNTVIFRTYSSFNYAGVDGGASGITVTTSTTINVGSFLANQTYEVSLNAITGVVGAKDLFLKIDRFASGGGSDTFGGDVKLSNLEII